MTAAVTLTLEKPDALAALQAFQDGALTYRLSAAVEPDPDARAFFEERARVLTEQVQRIADELGYAEPRRCDFIEPCDSPAAPDSKFCRFHRDLTAGKFPEYEREGRA